MGAFRFDLKLIEASGLPVATARLLDRKSLSVLHGLLQSRSKTRWARRNLAVAPCFKLTGLGPLAPCPHGPGAASTDRRLSGGAGYGKFEGEEKE